MKNLILSLIVCFSFASQAERTLAADPNFSCESAQKAFAMSRPPTYDELLGTWTLIGFVSVRGTDNGYWPDGKIAIKGQPGFFKELSVYTTATNGFGWTIVKLAGSLVGYETGKVYSQYQLTGELNLNGLVFHVAEDNDQNFCPAKVECRYFESKNMLLCRNDSQPSNKNGCSKVEIKGERYNGHFKLP